MHRLDPLLRPSSVAVVGASATANSMGEWALSNLERGGFAGPIYPVNPRYATLANRDCYPSVGALPEVPELVIFAVGDRNLEAALDEAIAAGIPAAVIMSTLYLDDDPAPNLNARVRRKARDAGMLVCGANGMGFYNVRDHVWACGFDSGPHAAPGSVALISHSGAGMAGLIDADARLEINLAVSTGNEISVTLDEYLDFALDLPETRAVGLFIETARNPSGLVAGFDKAAARGIPIVALKVGRTAASAKLAESHSGAMAGDDAAFQAVFDRFGVTRVRDMDELATTLILFAHLHPVADGGLVTLHDSGGERQLLIDLAADAKVPLTTLEPDTVTRLEQVLDPELPAVNPLDAWSRGGPDAEAQMAHCLSILMQDPGAAMGAVVHNRGPDGEIYPGYVRYLERAHADSGKPVALVAARQGTGPDDLAVSTTRRGFPVLDGVMPFLRGVQALFAYRDFTRRDPVRIQPPDPQLVAAWKSRLAGQTTISEADSLALLADFGLDVVLFESVAGRDAALDAADRVGFPAVLKTAAGVSHKTDVGGVKVNLRDAAELAAAYDDLAERLGPTALVAAMAPAGVEMLMGAKLDQHFGPLIVFGFGGLLAETLRDVKFAIPPVDAAYVRRALDGLRLRPLLDGARGAPAVDVDAFCSSVAVFSELVAALGDSLAEIDVNPVIAHAHGCVAVDALIVPSGSTEAA